MAKVLERFGQTALDAGLRYVSDTGPGIRRVASRGGFRYLSPSGAKITDDAILTRIRALAIPPAYQDVWISPHPNGHIQATARDARGRKQYRYHAKWRAARDETKFHRMLAFAAALPRMRQRIQEHLKLPGMPRDKVLAAVVELLAETTIRVGNDEYARENGSYGLTTMRNEHAQVRGDTIRFTFKGKSGIRHAISLRDKRLAKIVRAAQDIEGQELFGYMDDDGMAHDITSGDVNAYLREISGGDFTAKDFRTWTATVHCASLLASAEAAGTIAERKRLVNEALQDVAKRLGNTPAVCKKSYVHPAIMDAYIEEGMLSSKHVRSSRRLRPEERFVVAFLKHRASDSPEKRTMRKLKESIAKRRAAA